uniref:Uncharacterized protein n=1 Tax=Romanomermis culicivorax TaxID=13658 RepID=A0A915L481_ROMCU
MRQLTRKLMIDKEERSKNSKKIKNDIMPFPSITFCNLSPYKRSELHRIPDLEKLNNLIETLDDLNSTKESDQQPNIRKNSKKPLKKSRA